MGQRINSYFQFESDYHSMKLLTWSNSTRTWVWYSYTKVGYNFAIIWACQCKGIGRQKSKIKNFKQEAIKFSNTLSRIYSKILMASSTPNPSNEIKLNYCYKNGLCAPFTKVCILTFSLTLTLSRLFQAYLNVTTLCKLNSLSIICFKCSNMNGARY